MNLDEKLKELKEEVPQVNYDLETIIYDKAKKANPRRKHFWNKLTISLGSVILVILLITIGLISYNQYHHQQIDSSARLLKTVTEPKDKLEKTEMYQEFCDKLNTFSSELAYLSLKSLDETRNSVISPVSIFSALALATECSEGSSREQLLNAIGMDYDMLSLNYKKLYQEINRAGFRNNDSKVKSKLTNSIWIDNSFEYEDSCLNQLAEQYYSYTHSMDLNKKESIKEYIKEFISKQTDGFLKPDYQLSHDTIFLLINTLYLKDVWKSTGKDISLTEERYNFRNFDGSIKNGKLLMGKYIAGKAFEEDGYKEFYTSTAHGYKVYFIVPKDGYTIDEVFTSNTIASVTKRIYLTYNEEKTEHYNTRVFFPEFSAETSLGLEDVFDRLGITNIFNFEEADFTNLTKEKVFCNKVSHYAKLKVNRKGIEGGAVTFFEGAGAPGPSQIQEIYYDFVVDRSFGYVITDSSGINMFSGVIRSI